MEKKFLLADDDRDDSELFCEALSETDPSVVCYVAGDGRELFEMLKEKKFGLPDVIFLDLNMPEMNGWECLKALKSQAAYEKIPVIIYSTSAADRDIRRAYELGASYFFTKPDNYRDLKHFIGLIVRNVNGNLAEVLGKKGKG